MSDEPQGGVLYLIATPIGNLGDITQRALRYLEKVDILLAEDTRHSGILLGQYSIRRSMRAFHSYNQSREIPKVLAALSDGQSVGLISDGGTPGISDPAFSLVKLALEQGLRVSTLPGPCAMTAALPITGLVPHRFVFGGFLPTKQGKRRTELTALLGAGMPVILYESAQRLPNLLTLLGELAPERTCAICRELTKVYEEVRRGTASEISAYYAVHPLKGECVVVVG